MVPSPGIPFRPVRDFPVIKAFRDFQKAGLTALSMKLYPEDRQELLNELDKKKVYEDIYSWILERIKEYQL